MTDLLWLLTRPSMRAILFVAGVLLALLVALPLAWGW